MFFSTIVVLAGVGLASAQTISSQCQSTLIGLATNPEADCLNVSGLAPLFLSSSNASLVGPLTSWLDGLCTLPACTTQDLTDISNNVTAGCGNDLFSTGTANSTIQEIYPIFKSLACLKDTTNNTLCATTLLDQIEAFEGQNLTISNIFADLPAAVEGGLSSFPTYITCSDCVKAAYNVFAQDDPSTANSTTVTNALTSQCGASFIDGTTPTEIVQGTSSTSSPSATTTSNTNSAVPVYRGTLLGLAISALTAVSTTFVFLA